jgi:uncharacterized protein YkwD
MPATAAARCTGETVRPSSTTLGTIRAATLCLINVNRVRHGLDRLTENARLTTAATAYSNAMVRRHFFGHVDPDGTTIADRLFKVGYLTDRLRDWLTGENVTWAQTSRSTPARVVSDWMRSPIHRDNILDPRFREIGLGVALGSPEGDPPDKAATYTTDFGMVHRPASAGTHASRSRRVSCARKASQAARAVKGNAAKRRAARRALKRCLHSA